MKKLFFALGAFVLLVPAMAGAIEYTEPDEAGNDVISADEQVKNLYSFANNVVVDADVEGDFVGGGAYVAINGNVQNSAMAAGANVVLSGDVGQNARFAGGNIQISGNVDEDLLTAGGTIQIDQDAVIGGDFASIDGVVSINGDIKGNVSVTGGQVVIDGTIYGSVTATGVDQLSFGDNAVIYNGVKYSSPNEATIGAKANIQGGIEYEQIASGEQTMAPLKFLAGLTTVGTLIGFLSLYGLILVFAYLLKRFTNLAIERSFKNTWAMFGCGLLTLIVTPIAIFILMLSLVGLQAGSVLGAVYFALMLVARPLGAIMVGVLLFRWFGKNKTELRIDWLTGLVGAVVVSALMLIPFVGWIIPFILYMIVLGVIAKWTWDWAGRNK